MPVSHSIATSLTEEERQAFFPEPLQADLLRVAPGIRFLDPADDFRGELAAAAPEVLLAAWATPSLADPPPSLRYVCYVAGSVRQLVTRSQIAGGLLVTNWGGSISRTVAEAALWHILTGLRRGTRWTLAMHCDRAWRQPQEDTASLFGRRVGIHGFGHVARELVRLLQPFGCVISVSAPDVDATAAPSHGVAAAPSLEALFRDSDIVVEAAPLTPATTGIVTEPLLRSLKPGSVFVNIGRGRVVDEAALARVAAAGMVYFGLDVFAREPLPADSPLRGLPNVSLTPHLAGPTSDRCVDAGAFALANLRAYLAGRPLQAVVTPAVYDAST
jgi:phosphoglycerate dehydrogenase-like enzyme